MPDILVPADEHGVSAPGIADDRRARRSHAAASTPEATQPTASPADGQPTTDRRRPASVSEQDGPTSSGESLHPIQGPDRGQERRLHPHPREGRLRSSTGSSIVLTEGEVYEIGDVAARFSIQSVSKVFTLARILEDVGADTVDKSIGAQRHRTAVQLDPRHSSSNKDHPAGNPLVNPGAIATVSLVPAATPNERWSTNQRDARGLRGAQADRQRRGLQLGERDQHAQPRDRRLLKDYEVIQGDPLRGARSVHAPVLGDRDRARPGRHGRDAGERRAQPADGEQVVSPQTAAQVLADHADGGPLRDDGQWLYNVGVPAKSGVGGGIVAVVPGRFAIGTFSPPLDAAGNSVRGQRAIEAMIRGWAATCSRRGRRGARARRARRAGACRSHHRRRGQELTCAASVDVVAPVPLLDILTLLVVPQARAPGATAADRRGEGHAGARRPARYRPTGAPQPPLAPAAVTGRRAARAQRSERRRKEPARGLRPGHGLRHPVRRRCLQAAHRSGQAAYKFEPVYQRRQRSRTATRSSCCAPSWAATSSASGSTSGPASSSRRNPPYLLDSYVELAPVEGVQAAHRPAVDAVRSPRVLRPAGDPVPRVGARERVLLDGPRQGRHGAWARWPSSSTTALGVYSGTPLRQFNALPGNYVLRGARHLEPARSHGRDRVPVHRVRGAGAVPRVGDAAGLLRQDPERDGELQPVDVPLRDDGDGRHAQARRGRRRLLAAGPPGPRSTSTASSAARSRPWARRTRRSASGARSACRSSPRRWTSRRASTGSTPAPTSTNDAFYSIEGQLAYYVSHSPGLVVKLRYALRATRTRPAWPRSGRCRSSSPPGLTQLGTLQLNLAF